jgi:hypothetical protein
MRGNHPAAHTTPVSYFSPPRSCRRGSMTTQDHETPVRPGNGGNGGPCTPSTTVNVTASADPSGSIQSDTTVQLSADGSVVTVHKDCTTHEQPVRTGTWSLSLSTPQGGTRATREPAIGGESVV